MAWKILLALIFDGATGKTVQMFVRNVEPGMVKFTNDWYLFHRDGKFVIKNLVEGITYETSDDQNEPINPDMIKAIIRILNEELGYHINTEVDVPVNATVTETAVDPDLGKTSESAYDEAAAEVVADTVAEKNPENASLIVNTTDISAPDNGGVVETINPEPVKSPEAMTPLEKARATKAANAVAKKAAAK